MDNNPRIDEESTLTRRMFVGGALVAGTGLAIAGLSACSGSETPPQPENPGEPLQEGSGTEESHTQGINERGSDMSRVFVIRETDGTDDGAQRLRALMEKSGLSFYQTPDFPAGLIAGNDVVLLKINCQWAERGGTNTDLLANVAQLIAEHPSGFTGEIIIADNGQAQYGSQRNGGSLDWETTNSASRTRSALDVVNELKPQMAISGSLWDEFTMNRVGEFEDDDMDDGFVVDDTVQATGIQISYAKFTTEYGTKVSFAKGIWDETKGLYDSARLKIINLPVLKVHGLFQVTGAVKAYMGINASKLTNQSSHNSVGNGGMGTLMAHTRMPTLNIMDMIWVGVTRGPGITFDNAVQKNMIAASTDPVALDWWCTREVLIPELPTSGDQVKHADPESTDPNSFGYWLGLSAAELQAAGIVANRGQFVEIVES